MDHSGAMQDLVQLEAAAVRAAQRGNDPEAMQLWDRVLSIHPTHQQALAAKGRHAFRKGDLAAAHVAFSRLVEAAGQDPEHWVSLALVCQGQKDDQGEEEALAGALKADPSDLLALILRGNLFERQGRKHQAAAAYGAASAVAPSMDRLRPELRPAVLHARAYRERHQADMASFLDAFLEPYFREHAGERLDRFRDSLDIMVGRKRRFDSQSMIHHFPGLPAIEFFDRADFPWLDSIEASADTIRSEFLSVLRLESGFTPYINFPDGTPLNQWGQLNNSPDWSAFHLYKSGERIDANAARCPATMSALEAAPQPWQTGRTPSAMFSLLKPRTHIPPHTGVSNVRLVTHLPLIIPSNCRFRVGNEVRQWVPGKAWVFDDTIEHEAWNDSDELRVVLIFDIWNPLLSPVERAMVSAMSKALNVFSESIAGGFEL
jgi:aspartate beta-hydroxylase